MNFKFRWQLKNNTVEFAKGSEFLEEVHTYNWPNSFNFIDWKENMSFNAKRECKAIYGEDYIKDIWLVEVE